MLSPITRSVIGRNDSTVRRRSPACRRALSLAELLAVLVIVGVAGGAIGRVLTHHQRRFAQLAERSLDGARLREGASLLVAALRDVTPSAGDIYADEMSHTSIAFRAPIGSFVVCNRPPGDGASIDVVTSAAFVRAPLVDSSSAWAGGPSAQPPASLTHAPIAGDSIHAYDAGNSFGAHDDRWSRHIIASVGAGDCGAGVPRAHRLTLAPLPPSSLEQHAPVTTFRRTRFALYQSAGGDWYLGMTECDATRSPACPPVQPVAGPFAAGAPAGDTINGGLHIAYFDSAGVPTRDALHVARLRLRLRPPAGGDTTTALAPLATAIGFRNLRR